MKIDIVTIFPEMFENVFSSSIVKIAQKKKLVEINIHNLRDFTQDKHRKVDSPPYGGGPGMILLCEPLFSAVKHLSGSRRKNSQKVVLLTPQGRLLNSDIAKSLLKHKHLVLICGRYEGVDERVKEDLVDEQISIGDYVLSGGEIPAMVLVEVLTRLIPGVVGDCKSLWRESFEDDLLDCPHYTKPRVFCGNCVPEVLFSGNHKRIEAWRKEKAFEKTKKLRPDLWKRKAKKAKQRGKKKSIGSS